MSTISTERTIAELVLERPARSRIFESLGIDYCCGGKKTLAAVCAKKQLDPQEVVALLVAGDAVPTEASAPDYTAFTLSDLIADILAQHHEYLRQELPRLEAMLTKVTRVHGDREPRLAPMLAAFLGFAQELGTHMMKEERILFPAIARMEQEGTAEGHCFGSVAQPIAQMEAEHDDAGNALALLRGLSDDFTPPEWACNTYRAMIDGLHELEQNMHLHVHKENNVLFPKAIHLESALRQSAR